MWACGLIPPTTPRARRLGLAWSRWFERNGRSMQLHEHLLHVGRADGLDELAVEPGGAPRFRPLDAVASDGDQQRVLEAAVLTQPAGDLVAVHAGKADVQQHGVGKELSRGLLTLLHLRKRRAS